MSLFTKQEDRKMEALFIPTAGNTTLKSLEVHPECHHTLQSFILSHFHIWHLLNLFSFEFYNIQLANSNLLKIDFIL